MITLLRVLNFGKTYNIWCLFIYKTKDSPNFIIITILIVIMYLYLKMLNVLLRDTFYKIHLYFYNNEFYYKYMDLFWSKGNTDFLIMTTIYFYLKNILIERDSYTSKSESILYLRNKITSNKWLNFYCTKFYEYLKKYYHLHIVEECFHYYFPHIVVFNILLYDLRNYQIKYFYFFIFIFFFDLMTSKNDVHNFLGVGV